RQIVRDGKGRVWVAAKHLLLRLEGRPGDLHLREVHLPGGYFGIRNDQQPVALEVDSEGRLWVGYQFGIAWLDDRDEWHTLKTDQPVTAIRSFSLSRDDIWIAHRIAGSFTRLHREGELWKTTVFPATAGYTPPDSHFLKHDSRGWIWRGSPEGVYVSDGRHV